MPYFVLLCSVSFSWGLDELESSLTAMRHKKIASERQEPAWALAMDYSDTDSDSTLGYSDDEDSSDEAHRVSESVPRKLCLQIFGVFFMLYDFMERNGISNFSRKA